MRPAARVQSAIELLDEIILAARQGGGSADKVAQDFFRSRRYMGSGDRRAVRDLAWQAVRTFGEIPVSGRAAMLALADGDNNLSALFNGETHSPVQISDTEERAAGGPVPEWVKPRLYDCVSQNDEELSELLKRAPLDIRYRSERVSRDSLSGHFPHISFSETLQSAARLPGGTRLEASEPWQSGAMEVQDWGSQAICDFCAVDDADLVIDLCAGAGGKTLALADRLPGSPRIVAADIDRKRLSAMRPRLERAGVSTVTQCLMDPGKELDALTQYRGKADLVLVDAPCSGTGTWRRNPETRWRLTEDRLSRLVDAQARLLDIAAELVRPGGCIVYATCSLLVEEGANQVTAFLARRQQYSVHQCEPMMGRTVTDKGAGPLGTVLTPFHDETDGFFFTRLNAL